MLMQNIIIIKEGNTPEPFLKAWGRAFKDCYDKVEKRDKATAREYEVLVCVCADAVLLIEKKPLRYHKTQAAVIEGLEAFAKRFQTEVIEQGENPHQAGRRMEIIQEAIEVIKKPVEVIQTSLFS